MAIKTTRKLATLFTTIILGIGINTQLIANELDDANIEKIARELGVIQQELTAQFKKQEIKSTHGRAVKNDPYASKRAAIARQNIARKIAYKKRLAEITRKNRERVLNAQRAHQLGSHNNVWNRVYKGYQFRNNNNNRRLVKRFVRQFSRDPARIQRLADRSSDYLYMVVSELNRRNMPTELALLPFVESAYRNTAYSHAGAAGMWQFIPATGRRFGLKQTRSYDARLDPHQATNAAFDYLQRLNKEFKGDWFKSLAAYNAGEYRIHRAVARNKKRGLPTDYWNLKLPRETTQYVPRLLAFKQILTHPQSFRISLNSIPNRPALARIFVNKAVNLRKVAKVAGISSKQLLSINSGYLHGITTPRYSNTILLPRQHAGKLNRIIKSLPPAADVHNKYAGRSRWRGRSYTVRRGDSLYRIARKYGTTVKRIKRINRLRSNMIKPGKRLKIA